MHPPDGLATSKEPPADHHRQDPAQRPRRLHGARHSALALLARITDAIENHDDVPAEGLRWGHFGDIAETEKALCQIADRLFNEGEYAG